jgi:ABC-type Mn2+/Zn2+ transport system ATPase subunit
MKILSVENLTVYLDSAAIVDSVSLTVDEGDVVAIIGPNGAGKTTLLRALLGLLPARSGTVRIFGRPLEELGSERDRLGYVPQSMELDRTIPITVGEFMAIGTPRRYYSRQAAERALAEVDAARLFERQVGRLSGGELQRVLIAVNLLRNPRILFLDEPSTGIDLEGERLFYDILVNLRASRGMAVLMVSHDISVVYRYASRVLCIDRRLLCQGAPSEVLNDQTLERLYGHSASVYEHRGPAG